MKKIDIGFSTCPNDTFIFHAMLHNCMETGDLNFIPHLHDVEVLNLQAFSKRFHISKLSFYAYLKLRKHYEILDSGSALGYGCGPLLIAKSPDIDISTAEIAVPGELTTANLLLKLWNPDVKNVKAIRFDNILESVRLGKFDAGVIIHEGRFVYKNYGCEKIIDLGEWWEHETGLPIPLGCIALRKDSDLIPIKKDIESIIKESVLYGFNNRSESEKYIKQHALELDDEVIDGHIDLYVNDFTLSLGSSGQKAVKTLEEMAQWKKIL